jgi:hypothetical protein
MIAAKGQPIDARTHISNDQAWRARQTGDLRHTINNNRVSHTRHDPTAEQVRRGSFTPIGPACFGPMVRGEPYPEGFKGPRDVEKCDPHSSHESMLFEGRALNH